MTGFEYLILPALNSRYLFLRRVLINYFNLVLTVTVTLRIDCTSFYSAVTQIPGAHFNTFLLVCLLSKDPDLLRAQSRHTGFVSF